MNNIPKTNPQMMVPPNIDRNTTRCPTSPYERFKFIPSHHHKHQHAHLNLKVSRRDFRSLTEDLIGLSKVSLSQESVNETAAKITSVGTPESKKQFASRRPCNN